MAGEFEFDPGFFDWLNHQPGIEEATKQAADKVLAVAKATAPVATGEYRDDLSVEKSDRAGRPVYRVGAPDTDYSLAIEARTGHLARAVKQA